MRLLYPCDPFEKGNPDDVYAEEFEATRTAGLTCSLFSAEDFESGRFRPRPVLEPEESVLYRGWMLTPGDYALLQAAIENKGARVFTTAAQYRGCHYLPEWYARCEALTPRTIFVQRGADFAHEMAKLNWSACFVKDFVKSLTTARGSIARSAAEVQEIVTLIEKYRGQVEGGVCLREIEEFQPGSEERYFVFRGKAYASEGLIPPIVNEIAAKIDSPFYSVDIALDTSNRYRLIEMGDGQVSDRKKWSAERFIEMLNS